MVGRVLRLRGLRPVLQEGSALHSGGDAGGDVAVGAAEDQDEAVGEGHSGTGDGEFVGPFEFLGQVVGAISGAEHNRIDGKVFRLDISDGAKLDATLPIEIEVEGTHEGAREIGAGGGVLELRGTRMIVDDEGENELVGEVRKGFGAAAENGAGDVAVDAFEIVEEIGSADAALNAEAGAAGDRAVGYQTEAAVVVPNGFFAGW